VKEFIPLAELPAKISAELVSMQKELLEKARAFREANTHDVDSYETFKSMLEEKGGFYRVPWCRDADVEAAIKTETKATVRCFLLDENNEPMKTSKPCFKTGKTDGNVIAIFARSY
jgi:prolyl-tRNA synthetase